jgi:hypothetical protein
MLAKAVRLIGETLREQGQQVDVDRAVAAFNDAYCTNA